MESRRENIEEYAGRPSRAVRNAILANAISEGLMLRGVVMHHRSNRHPAKETGLLTEQQSDIGAPYAESSFTTLIGVLRRGIDINDFA
jgi:hypothetical protein